MLAGGYAEAIRAWHRQFDETRLAATQKKRFLRIVRYAHENVAYYRRSFDLAGVDPAGVAHIDDIERLPLITKRDVRDSFVSLVSKDLPASRLDSTSGTTSEPMAFLKEKRFRIYNSANVIRRQLNAKVSLFGERIASVGCLPLDESYPTSARRYGFLHGLQIHQSIYVHTDRADFEQFSPTVIISMPEILRLLAIRALEGSLSIHPRVVVSHSQTLPPDVRHLIGKAFGCKVVDSYGLEEFGEVAAECWSGSLHVNSDCFVVEVLRDGQPCAPGEMGEICITGLLNHSMPLIRYLTDDIGVLSSSRCACGSVLPVIDRIEGRRSDFWSVGDGTLSPAAVCGIMSNVLRSFEPGCYRQYQLVQQGEDTIVVRYVPGPSFTTDVGEYTVRQLRRFVGDSVAVVLNEVQEIPFPRSGKLQVVDSLD